MEELFDDETVVAVRQLHLGVPDQNAGTPVAISLDDFCVATHLSRMTVIKTIREVIQADRLAQEKRRTPHGGQAVQREPRRSELPSRAQRCRRRTSAHAMGGSTDRAICELYELTRVATHLFDSGERAIRVDASEKDLHHLRLAAKKFRYTEELFATSCRPAVNDWLERATRAPTWRSTAWRLWCSQGVRSASNRYIILGSILECLQHSNDPVKLERTGGLRPSLRPFAVASSIVVPGCARRRRSRRSSCWHTATIRGFRPRSGNPQALSHTGETDENPRGCWTLKDCRLKRPELHLLRIYEISELSEITGPTESEETSRPDLRQEKGGY
jgi:hypothetical protein